MNTLADLRNRTENLLTCEQTDKNTLDSGREVVGPSPRSVQLQLKAPMTWSWIPNPRIIAISTVGDMYCFTRYGRIHFTATECDNNSPFRTPLRYCNLLKSGPRAIDHTGRALRISMSASDPIQSRDVMLDAVLISQLYADLQGARDPTGCLLGAIMILIT